MLTSAHRTAFIRQHAPLSAPPLCAELRLHLAQPGTPLWTAGPRELAAWELDAPFWAFCWAAGAALAQHVLDTPALVRDQVVVDVGAGCGVVAIAAARAGARSVIAVDMDPWCVDAIHLNAQANGVNVDARAQDVTTLELPPGAVLLAADVLYDADTAHGLWPWLLQRAKQGHAAWLADAGRGVLRADHALRDERTYAVPTDPAFEPAATMHVRVGRP